jgi:CheY-like chemotaxis protein
MQYSQTTPARILFVGNKIKIADCVYKMLIDKGVTLIFTEDADEAIKAFFNEKPDLIVCDLEDEMAILFSKTLKTMKSNLKMPVMLGFDNAEELTSFFETEREYKQKPYTDYNNGNNSLNPESNTELTLTESAYLPEFLNMQDLYESRKREFIELKNRHLQTLDIIRETSELFRKMYSDNRTAYSETPIDFGINMINSLAAILDEQIRSLEGWFEPEGLSSSNLNYQEKPQRPAKLSLAN